MNKTEQIILGIDPGTNIMGYGLICAKGTKISLIKMGILKLDAKKNALNKLEDIFTSVSSLITTYQPQEMAIEAPFFGKNVQSMLKLGRAQGVAIAAGLHHHLPIYEYAPRKVKMAIVGKGAASKEQVCSMLSNLVNGMNSEDIPAFDASDAVAIAYCHYLQNKQLTNNSKSYAGWEGFLSQNKDRIIR